MTLDGLKPFKDGEPTPINEGGPAFPTTFSVDAHGRCIGIHDSTARIESVAGMTLRDWMTGNILSGFAANPAVFAYNGMSGWGLVNCNDADLAGYAAKLADEAIKALKAKEG